ncbi:hypothetical protein [Desulfovibrio sp.]|uniref:hypothetical protein n=1 Tax=Desulfovibrio sp. TaxID=885 RepID=UPI0025C6AAB6|nr:hypothetical protein [Desulfovibrio sp.]
MSEIYTILVEGSRLRFEPRQDDALNDIPVPGKRSGDYEIVSRMGDPGLLHCAVFRRGEGSGGCFALYDGNGPLFAAVAESNLAFGLGQGFFGKMVSDARYGADIFENMDESDD